MPHLALDIHYNPVLHETYGLNIKHKIRKICKPIITAKISSKMLH
jgi:hypothetical protein